MAAILFRGRWVKGLQPAMLYFHYIKHYTTESIDCYVDIVPTFKDRVNNGLKLRQHGANDLDSPTKSLLNPPLHITLHH